MDGNHARALLGVPTHATTEQVRRAFRGAAFVAHPDQGGDDGRFRLLLDARDVLLADAAASPVACERKANPYAAHCSAPTRPTFSTVDEPRPAPRPAPWPTVTAAAASSSFDDVLASVLAEAA